MKNVAIIINTGFDGGGATTLGIEYSKLGLDVYFKDVIQLRQFKTEGNYKLYKTEEELLNIIQQYDRFIMGQMNIGVPLNKLYEWCKSSKIIKILLQIRKDYPNKEIYYLNCARKLEAYTIINKYMNDNGFHFDKTISLSNNTRMTEDDKFIIRDINAFQFGDTEFNLNPKNIVFTTGRIEGVKNINKYIDHANEFLGKIPGFEFIHCGANWSTTKNGNYSIPTSMLGFFDLSKKPKQPRPEFSLKEYGEEPEPGKLTLYPSYNRDNIVEWKNYFIGVCPILGTVSKCKKNLFGNYTPIEKREATSISKSTQQWSNSLEYADLEKLSMGIPILFSINYAKLMNITDNRMIYNNFSDIVNKVKYLSEHRDEYEECRKAYYEFFKNKQKVINENIKNEFLKE